jgi:hypothetical protein
MSRSSFELIDEILTWQTYEIDDAMQRRICARQRAIAKPNNQKGTKSWLL